MRGGWGSQADTGAQAAEIGGSDGGRGRFGEED